MGGDPAAPTAMESTQSMLEAYQKYAPSLMKTYQENILPNEQAQLAASQAVSPGYSQLQNELYKVYGPQLAQTGVDVNRINELGQINTDTEALKAAQQTGGLLDQTYKAQQQADPYMAKYQKQVSDQLSNLLGSIDVNGLSGSERAETSRSLARDNAMRGTENPTALSTISNAMTFGNQLQKKRDSLGQALTQASSVAPSLSSGINAFTTTTGRSSSANTGIPQFAGTQQTGSSTQNQGTNLLNNIAGFQNTAMGVNANNRDSLDRVMQVGNGIVGSTCCFIFMEAYNGLMPWWVRKCRDAYYTPTRRLGYVRTAKVLVPLMEKSKFIRQLVNDTMIAPLTSYGGHLFNVKGYEDGRKYKGYTNFWFKVWDLIGKI